MATLPEGITAQQSIVKQDHLNIRLSIDAGPLLAALGSVRDAGAALPASVTVSGHYENMNYGQALASLSNPGPYQHTFNFVPVASNSANQYYSYFPPKTDTGDVQKEVELPPGPSTWRESDFIDRAELFKSMQAESDWDYAQCMWLMLQEEHDSAFPGDWQRWFDYAVEHCPRFKAEQPRWRRG